MASAQSLLGLMNQLQNLESNVASILIEASLKLCSLTDINVFFLVETADGRRFAGNPQLCDRFRRGGLLAADSDIECVVNPAVSALEERGPGGGHPAGGGHPTAASTRPGLHRLPTPVCRNGFNGFDAVSSFTAPNRKRSLPRADAASRAPKNFKSSNDAGGSEKESGVDVVQNSGGGDLSLDTFSVGEDGDALAVDVKEEEGEEEEERERDRRDSNLSVADDSADDAFSQFDLTDDDIVEVPLSDRSISRALQDSVDSSSSVANDSYNNWQLTPGSSSHLTATNRQQQPAPSGPPVMDFINDVYPQSLLDKLKALDSFNVDVIFDPTAAPRKVLNSILHEVGTKLATSCPYWPRHLSNPQLKEWLISNIEVFIGKFSVMQRICDDRHKVYIGKKAMSKLTYVKNNIRSSYDKQFKSNPKDHDFGQVLA